MRLCACVAVVVVVLAGFGADHVWAYGDGFESGDLTAAPWVTDASRPWGVVAVSPQSGVYCVESGGIVAGESTSLSCVLEFCAPSTISFWTRRACSSGYRLEFWVDSVCQESWLGPSDWSQQEFAVTAGFHRLTWRLWGLSGGGILEDRVYIDGVSFGNAVAPEAAFVFAPESEYEYLTYDFQDRSVGDVTAWVWGFGDGATSTMRNPSHVYATAGTYEVTLLVMNGAWSDRVTHAVVIEVPQPPDASFSAVPTMGSSPLDVAFSDGTTGLTTSWSWDFGDGGTSTEPNPTHRYLADGGYTVSLTVQGPGGTDTATTTRYVIVGDPTPTPDPMGFAVEPTAWSATGVAMAAQEAASVGNVEYLFEETTGGAGATGSSWQPSPYYVDDGLEPGRTYAYRVKARGAVGFETGWSAERSVTTLPREGFEGGDLTTSPVGWTSTTTAPWVVQGDVVWSGGWAAASASGLPDGGTSTLSVSRDCLAGWVSFRLRVSSQASADVLRFSVDGEEQTQWSGEVAWAEYAVAVGAGEHSFSWEYAKDASGSAGDDRAYLDDVELPAQVAAVIEPEPETVYVEVGGGGCVVGSEASGAGALLAVLLPLGLVGLRKRARLRWAGRKAPRSDGGRLSRIPALP